MNERHTTDKPCLACRYLVKGNEQHANALRCEACRHFHRPGPCPEVLDYNGPSEQQISDMVNRLPEPVFTMFDKDDPR